MNDEMLDYGESTDRDDVRERRTDAGRSEGQEQELDAEMQDWTNNYDGDMDQFEESRERKVQELREARKGTRFYPLPREEGISAGAKRGVSSQGILDDETILGPEEEVAAPELPSPIGGGQDVRYSVLHLSGSPVTQCSTSRLFAYLTHYGAQPMGLEWVNDSSCNVVFGNPGAARLALEYLCPAVSISRAPLVPLPGEPDLDKASARKERLDHPDDQEGTMESDLDWDTVLMQSLLIPRKAQRIPAKLYNAPERDAAAALREEEGNGAASQLPDDVPEIYREMEAEDRKRKMMKPEQINLQKLRGTLWMRWALESLDVKPSRAAKQSNWYREHGNDAGKEVVTKLLDVGHANERLELLPSGNGNERSNRRAGGGAGAEVGARGRGGRQAAMDELDSELDKWRSNEGTEDGISGQNRSVAAHHSQRRRGRGGDRRGQWTMEALDEQLEYDRRDRSASPIRFQASHSRRDRQGDHRTGSTAVKVKGRGRMKAPSAWDDVDGGGDDGSRMASDDFAREYTSVGHQRRGPQLQRTEGQSSNLEQRITQSLEQRINGGRDLLDRMSR